jgi:hypothetical protein
MLANGPTHSCSIRTAGADRGVWFDRGQLPCERINLAGAI